MNKTSNSSFKDFNLDNDWTSHPAIEWIVSHKQSLIWAILGLFVAFIAAYFLLSQRTLHQEQDVFQAQNLFNQYQQAQTSEAQSTAYQDLKKIINRYPDLEAKYAGTLAQSSLIEGNLVEANEWATGIFKRTTSDHLQLYQQYAQTSLLIGEQAYSQALTQSQQLKEQLNQIDHLKDYSILYVFNLLRLGTLYQQLNQPEAEKQIWEELQKHPSYLTNLDALSQAIKIGQASLGYYIEENKK
jgi:hypothetical protein